MIGDSRPMSDASEQRLFAGVDAIEAATLVELRDARFVAEILRGVGLTYDSRQLYGADNAFMLPPEHTEDRKDGASARAACGRCRLSSPMRSSR